MIDSATIKIGDKVYYQPDHYKNDNRFENGIVKEAHTTTSVRCRKNKLFFLNFYNKYRTNVPLPEMGVYHCGGDWKNYKNFTSALTSITDLYKGWKHTEIEVTDKYLENERY